MTQQTINIGNVANDGQGDPLRTAFTKCNDNFSELYAATYSSLSNGASKVNVYEDSVITMTVGLSSNVVVANTDGISVTGNVSTGNLIATFLVQGTTMLAGGNITGGNLLTPSSGNVNAGNVLATYLVQGSQVTASGNVSAGNVNATGNITGSVVRSTGSFMVMPTGTSDPAGAVAGAFYYNTSLPALRVYNGSAWVSV